jgi:hypothetical protein
MLRAKSPRALEIDATSSFSARPKLPRSPRCANDDDFTLFHSVIVSLACAIPEPGPAVYMQWPIRA